MNPCLVDFVRESDRIEGILPSRARLATDVEAHERLLKLPRITVADLAAFVCAVQPAAVLRDRPGLDVVVGGHVPPAGGPGVEADLSYLLYRVNRREIGDYDAHLEYRRGEGWFT